MRFSARPAGNGETRPAVRAVSVHAVARTKARPEEIYSDPRRGRPASREVRPGRQAGRQHPGLMISHHLRRPAAVRPAGLALRPRRPARCVLRAPPPSCLPYTTKHHSIPSVPLRQVQRGHEWQTSH